MEELDIDINKNEFYKALLMIMKPKETILSVKIKYH